MVGAFCILDERNAEKWPEEMDQRVVVVYAVILLEVTIAGVVFGYLLKCNYLRECWTITFDGHT